MTKTILQIENTNTSDFKEEILSGVSNLLKDFSSNTNNGDSSVLLTREETAKLLSVSLVTLWKWTKKDIVPAYRIGSKVRYKKKEVLEALKQMNQFG